MKAIVYSKYGPPDVLQLQEIEKPIPNDDQVLVQVRAASVNIADWYYVTGPLVLRLMAGGFLAPKSKSVGTDMAGRVEAVGRNVTQFKPGDEVFGAKRGAFAEYVCAREDVLVPKPANTTFEQAAAVPVAALTALQGLRDVGQIQPGQKVLVYGASGGVGTFAVQIAKSFGAYVTAVCSTRNLDAARSIGADQAIDYTREDFTRNGQRYDVILAVNGYRPVLDYVRALGPNGICVGAGGSMPKSLLNMLLGPWIAGTDGKKFSSFMAKVNKEDLRFLKELLEAGKVVPVVDRCYALSEASEALRYIGQGHARGKIVITP